MEIADFIALLAFFISLYGAIISTLLALNENLILLTTTPTKKYNYSN